MTTYENIRLTLGRLRVQLEKAKQREDTSQAADLIRQIKLLEPVENKAYRQEIKGNYDTTRRKNSNARKIFPRK